MSTSNLANDLDQTNSISEDEPDNLDNHVVDHNGFMYDPTVMDGINTPLPTKPHIANNYSVNFNDMTNQQLIDYEKDESNRSSDLAYELAQRLEEALKMLDFTINELGEVTDNDLIKSPEGFIKLDDLRKLTLTNQPTTATEQPKSDETTPAPKRTNPLTDSKAVKQGISIDTEQDHYWYTVTMEIDDDGNTVRFIEHYLTTSNDVLFVSTTQGVEVEEVADPIEVSQDDVKVLAKFHAISYENVIEVNGYSLEGYNINNDGTLEYIDQ